MSNNNEVAARPTPPEWPRISSAVVYENPRAAIDWLCKVFGFEIRLVVDGEGGTIAHCELELGADGLIMVAGPKDRFPNWKSPRQVGGANTQTLMAYIDDVDAHCARVRGFGAKVTMEPETHDYGEDFWSDRGYEVEDLDGHRWYFCQRLRSPAAKP